MKKLLFGAAYYDEYMPYDRLDKDIEMMKKAGINTVRIAESTWSTCEPQDGVFDFSHVERVMDAICRKNQMKGFTDYAFCFPDARYEQMLLFMDKLVNKKAVFHIYTKKSGRLV